MSPPLNRGLRPPPNIPRRAEFDTWAILEAIRTQQRWQEFPEFRKLTADCLAASARISESFPEGSTESQGDRAAVGGDLVPESLKSASDSVEGFNLRARRHRLHTRANVGSVYNFLTCFGGEADSGAPPAELKVVTSQTESDGDAIDNGASPGMELSGHRQNLVLLKDPRVEALRERNAARLSLQKCQRYRDNCAEYETLASEVVKRASVPKVERMIAAEREKLAAIETECEKIESRMLRRSELFQLSASFTKTTVEAMKDINRV